MCYISKQYKVTVPGLKKLTTLLLYKFVLVCDYCVVTTLKPQYRVVCTILHGP
jgi:hypothetical protein